MNKSEQINELAAALAKAQAEMQNPHFDSNNPFFKSKYASLAAVRNAVIPVLTKYGLSVIQEICFGIEKQFPDLKLAWCRNTILHASGQWIEQEPFFVPVSKADAQGACAGATYARRASLQALACVVGDSDDDGEAAVGRGGDASQTNVAPPAKGYKPAYKKTGPPDPIPGNPDPAATFDGPPAATADPAGKPSVAVGFLNYLASASTEDQVAGTVKQIALVKNSLSEDEKKRLREAVDAANLRIRATPYKAPTGDALLKEIAGLRSQLGDGMFGVILKKHGGEDVAGLGLGLDGLKNVRDECVKAIG